MIKRGFLAANIAIHVFAADALEKRGKLDLAKRLRGIPDITDLATARAAKKEAYEVRSAADAAAAAADAAASAAAAAADAAADAAARERDRSLAEYAENVVQILIEMGAPGCEFLDLVPVEAM
jgi:hypothetical protein